MRIIDLGPHQFLEGPGETLRDATQAAVLTAREGMSGDVFDVAARGVRGPRVLTAGSDEAWIAAGIDAAYGELNASASVVTASDHLLDELPVPRQPALVEIRQATSGDPTQYSIDLLVTTDASPRSWLFQETKATLTPAAWGAFLRRAVVPRLIDLPRPFRVALAVGGTSAEACLATALRTEGGEFDHLPDVGDGMGAPIRLPMLEAELEAVVNDELSRHGTGGACSQVRIVRLVRHGGSLPVGLYIGLHTDRRVRVTLTPQGMDVTAIS